MGLHLVTGGSGYFGTLMVRFLREKGYPVRVFDLNDAEDRPADVEFIQGDIRDPESVERACEGVEVVHHNVAQVPLAKDRHLFWSVNVDGANNLFQATLHQRVKKVVHVSSSAVFGIPERNPVDENMVPRPMEAYGQAKYEAEKVAGRYIEKGLDITIVRPRTILGQGRLGIFSILFDLVRSGAKVPVLGRGDNRYQFVHASDLAEACLRAAHRPGPATYNIGTDRFGTMRELLEGLIRHANSRSKVISLPFGPAVAIMKMTDSLALSPLGDYHALMYGREMFFSLSKPMRELGWKPNCSNLEMICESYDWYCANYDRIMTDKDQSIHRRPVEQGIIRILKWL